MRDLEARIGGRVGVYALDTATGATLSHRARERFALCSTFKWVLAAAVLTRIDAGQFGLQRELPFSEADLLEYAPVTREHVGRGRLTVEALLDAALTLSDNTATNLLLPLVDDAAGLSHFMREVGDPVTRLDRREPLLNSNEPGDVRDTTTPEAMVCLMRTLLTTPALSPTSQQRLIGWMVASRTGAERLRAGLPGAWRVGDKTGTGANGAVNDVAIVWPKARPPWLIAAYLSESRRPLPELVACHAEVGRIVHRQFAA